MCFSAVCQSSRLSSFLCVKILTNLQNFLHRSDKQRLVGLYMLLIRHSSCVWWPNEMPQWNCNQMHPTPNANHVQIFCNCHCRTAIVRHKPCWQTTEVMLVHKKNMWLLSAPGGLEHLPMDLPKNQHSQNQLIYSDVTQPHQPILQLHPASDVPMNLSTSACNIISYLPHVFIWLDICCCMS